MNDLIAKKYIKALLIGVNLDSIITIYNDLKKISSAFAEEKFTSIISSPEVKNSDKVNLIISFLESSEDKLKNLIQLLGAKKRLYLIPEIVRGLGIQIAKMNNSYTGIIYSNKELSSSYVSSLQTQFGKKFNVNLLLSQDVCDYNGIKVDIDSFGIEISFSKMRLKSQMINHILKAV